MIDRLGSVPLFVEQGERFAANLDLDPEGSRLTEDNILRFVAAWEAFTVADIPVTDAYEIHEIGTWPTLESQDSFLRRLSE